MKPRAGPEVWKKLKKTDISIRDPKVATDFRGFVRAWLKNRDEHTREPSQANLAFSLPHWDDPAVGWPAPTLNHLLNEKKPPGRTFVERAETVAHAILKDPRERALLVALARRDAAADPETRSVLEEEVELARQALDIRPATFEHFDTVLPQWHRTVLLELAACEGFRDDPAWIRARLAVPVTEAEIRKSLAILERTKLLVRGEDGRLRRPDNLSQLEADRVQEAPDNLALGRLRRRSLIQHYKGLLPLVSPSLDHLDAEHRMMLGTLVHLPRRLMPKLQESLAQLLKEEGLRSDAQAEPADTVYQVGLFLLPAAVSDPDSPPAWFSQFREEAAAERSACPKGPSGEE